MFFRFHKMFLLPLALIVLLTVSSALAETIGPIKLKSSDKCPVCGMFVEKYPDFIAFMIFKDGSYVAFDGVKDLMKCYLSMNQYLPAKKHADIKAMYVTDYYSMHLVDAAKAHYIMGSDVFGPMGRELIPHENQDKAKEFLKDHAGKVLLRMQQITPAMLKELDS